MQHQLQGISMLLKPGVVPHIFKCQNRKQCEETRQTGENRRRRQLISQFINVQPSTENLPASLSTYASIEQDVPTSNQLSTSTLEDISGICDKIVHDSRIFPQRLNKGVQVNMKKTFRSKSTNTFKQTIKDAANSPIKVCLRTQNISPLKTEFLSHELESNKSYSDSSESDNLSLIDENSEIDSVESYKNDTFKLAMRNNFMKAIEMQPLLCLGLSKHCYFFCLKQSAVLN